MFERIDYIVGRIDGDYAYLNRLFLEDGNQQDDTEEKCVARALLPEAINIGTHLVYEMMQYRIEEE